MQGSEFDTRFGKGIETILPPDEARSFFPADSAHLFGLDEQEIAFWGLHTKKNKISGNANVVSEQYYVLALLNHFASKRWKYGDICFLDSKNRFIVPEHGAFDAVRKQHRTQLDGYYPLLALRITNWCQPEKTPWRFAEFTRYADHVQFRKRGISSATLDTICDRMHAKGTEFVYVNSIPFWPKSWHAISAYSDLIPRDEIMSCFPEEYRKIPEELEDGHRDEYSHKFLYAKWHPFFRFADPQRQEQAYAQELVLQEAARIRYEKKNRSQSEH